MDHFSVSPEDQFSVTPNTPDLVLRGEFAQPHQGQGRQEEFDGFAPPEALGGA
ncbi:MAG: hypothetical protein FJ102_25465, partial [Deltaproteobacteria bacterium]|nr:hypothetical protein [Deltaproteobacteria bacterium]